eukprot:9362668-Pyramimonas_sp.AAC.1
MGAKVAHVVPFLALLFALPACVKAEDAQLVAKYDHKSLQIIDGYDLYWSVDFTAEILKLAIQANTTGCVPSTAARVSV